MADETYWAAIAAELALAPEQGSTVVIEAPADGLFDPIAAVEDAEKFSKSWVIEIPVVGTVLEYFATRKDISVFRLDEVPGSLFATTEELSPGKSNVLVSDGVIGSRIDRFDDESNTAPQTITTLLKTAEERYVLGVVLVPETHDSQGDIYSHEEVRKAAHEYMEHAGHLGKAHREIVTKETLRILESYIAPVDFEADGQQVARGTWLMGIRVVDDDVWGRIKKGEFTGFSIGGQAYRRPETH